MGDAVANSTANAGADSTGYTTGSAAGNTARYAPLCGGFCAARGAALRGNANTASVAAKAIQQEAAVKEAINLARDIRTSFSMRATRSGS